MPSVANSPFRTNRQKPRRDRRKYANDPAVPLDAGRLREAIKQDGRSLAGIAREVRQRHRQSCTRQDLFHLTGPGKRCRASRRRALAAVLGIPEDWLSGQETVSAPSWLESAAIVGDAFGQPALGLPARLSARRFVEQCRRSLKRDPPPGSGEDPEEIIGELLNPALWRALLLGSNAARAVTISEISEITPVLADCLERLLRPWLERRRDRANVRLDYSRIVEWVGLMHRAEADQAP